MVFYRTYSRPKENGNKETWGETVQRVVNGTMSMQHRHFKLNRLEWDFPLGEKEAKEMFERIYSLKFVPPGRGLWAMGSALTEKRKLYASLNNCGFVSTKDVDDPRTSPAEPFCFLMDAAMLGVGVGFDVLGAGKLRCRSIERLPPKTVVIADSRDGWVDSLRVLLESHLYRRDGDRRRGQWTLHRPVFDYSQVRPAGQPIVGFGGVSSGPEPLKRLHDNLHSCLEHLANHSHEGVPITKTCIVDIMNLIGQCVVSGNVRRTAEIAFGDDSDEYINLKNYNVNKHRESYGWTSNNSIFAKVGQTYSDKLIDSIAMNGEPGFAWLENMQKFGRMDGIANNKDYRVAGGNPCLEQSLESYELCCLVETFPNHHETFEDFKQSLRYAFLYAKTVTLGETHWEKTNSVMRRNRRIGCSMSGIQQFIASRGLLELREWCEKGYDAIQSFDKEFSERFGVPQSIKTTCIKPSGTVSLLAGATPGMHAPESRFYIRRVRIPKNATDLVESLAFSGYHIEPSATDPENTVVVEFPIDVGKGVRTSPEISMWEQLSLAAFLQRYWADNQVSCTVTFNEKEKKDIKPALEHFQFLLKGVSFLPRLELGKTAYAQMPYEAITEEYYLNRKALLKPLVLKYDVVVPNQTKTVVAGEEGSATPEMCASPNFDEYDQDAGKAEFENRRREFSLGEPSARDYSDEDEDGDGDHDYEEKGSVLLPSRPDDFCESAKCEIRSSSISSTEQQSNPFGSLLKQGHLK